jgi:Dolichyl-phosphate-mannose-protein mannosyltransferase/PA14 domain
MVNPWLSAVRLVTMAAAIGLAIYAQIAVHTDTATAYTWVYFPIAALLAAAAAGRREREPSVAAPGTARGLKTALRIGLGALAVAAIGAATYLSTVRSLPGVALLLWLAAPLLASLAVRGWQVAPRHRAPLSWSGTEAALLAAIVCLAAMARVAWINTLPRAYFGDEPRVAMYLYNAYRNGLPNFFSMGWNTWPAIGLSLQGLFAPVFGLHLWTLRLSSAFMGTIAVLATYLLARELFTTRAALFAAFLFAVCRTAIDFSRLGITHAQILCLEPLAFFFLWRALNGGSALAYLWAGVATAWCLYSYNAGQLVPPLVFGWLLLGALVRPARIRTHWRGALLLGAAFALTLFPYLYYFTDGFGFAQNWGQFTVMARNRQSLGRALEAWQTAGFAPAWEILSRQAWYTWLGFGVLPGANYPLGYRRGGMLDDVSAALFVLGLGISIRRLLHARDAFVPYWWLGTVVAGGIATIDPPSFVRLVGLLPALAMLAALPVEWLTTYHAGRAPRLIGAVLALALAVGAAWDNYRTYFVAFAASPADPMSELARYMDALPPDHRAALIGAEHHIQFRGELFTIEFPDRWDDVAEPSHFFPLHQPMTAPLAIVLTQSQSTLSDYLHSLYPRAVISDVTGPGGQPFYFRSVIVTPDDVRERTGLALAATLTDGSTVELGRSDPFASQIDAPASTARLVWSGSVYWPIDRPLPVSVDAGQPTTVTFGDAPPIPAGERGQVQAVLTLRRGWQPMRVEQAATPQRRLAISLAGQPLSRWNLRPETAAEGLLATYIRGDGGSVHSIDPQLNAFAVEDRFPPHADLLVRMPFTATWRGSLLVRTPGRYQFEAQGTGPYSVRLDGERLVDGAPTMPEQPALARADRDLEPGLHPIEVTFDSSDKAHTTRRLFQLFWTPPDGTKQLIPPTNFSPDVGPDPEPEPEPD